METALFKYICNEIKTDLQGQDLKKETELIKYVCGKVMSDLRQGSPPDKTVISAVILQPWIDTLRSIVKIEDKKLIIELMRSSGFLLKRLGVSLTKKMDLDRDIRQALANIFKQELDLDIRFEAMYRLLDDPKLDNNLLAEVYDLAINKYYDQWQAHVIEWQGGIHNIMKQVPPKIHEKDHQGKRKYPEHKIWAYLHELSWVPDDQKERAKDIIRTCSDFHWPTDEVAKKLLKQMGAS